MTNEKYCKVEDNKEHLEKLLRFIVDEVCSAGGDGDAIWYSQYYDINDIYSFIKDDLAPRMRAECKFFNWELKLKGDTITWGQYQEWATITNDESIFIGAPSWSQFTLKY